MVRKALRPLSAAGVGGALAGEAEAQGCRVPLQPEVGCPPVLSSAERVEGGSAARKPAAGLLRGIHAQVRSAVCCLRKLTICLHHLESFVKMANAPCSRNMCELACMAALCQNVDIWCQGRGLYDYAALL